MLTHANLSSATAQYVETTHTQPPLLDEGHERILAVLPPFHIYALTVNMPYVLLVLILIFRPMGLLGTRET